MPEYDILVMGSGVAGLRAALAAQNTGARAVVFSTTLPVQSYDAASPGGFNTALSPSGSAGQHALNDTDAGVGEPRSKGGNHEHSWPRPI